MQEVWYSKKFRIIIKRLLMIVWHFVYILVYNIVFHYDKNSAVILFLLNLSLQKCKQIH